MRVLATGAVIGLLTAGCGDGPAAENPSTTAERQPEAPASVAVPADPELRTLSPRELRASLDRVRGQLETESDPRLRIPLALGLSRIARLLYVREADAADLRVARRALTDAAATQGVPLGACAAGLTLARMEALDAADPVEAHAVASRLFDRFDVERDPAAPMAEAPAPPPNEPVEDAGDLDSCLDALAHMRDTLASYAAAHRAEAGHAAVAEGPRPTLRRVTFYGDAQSAAARAVVEFDRVVVFEQGQAEASGDLPDRVWFDFAGIGVADGVARSVDVGAGGLRRIRRGEPTPGVTRLVFDLAPRVAHRVFFLPNPYRLIIDFSPRRRGNVPAVTPGQAHPARVIVLDPGHGGREFGATNGRLRESHLALDIARRAAISLQSLLPGVRVLLTRNDDTTVSLEERTAMANAVGADLFVSIHLNDGEGVIRHGGVTTFILDTQGDRQAMRLAARENGTTTAEVSGLQRLLAGLHRREQVAASRELAERVHQGTLLGGRSVLPSLGDRGVQTATFHVLVGARMPAILLEASFVSQPDEARMLATERYRQALASGIAAGILRYVRGG